MLNTANCYRVASYACFLAAGMIALGLYLEFRASDLAEETAFKRDAAPLKAEGLETLASVEGDTVPASHLELGD